MTDSERLIVRDGSFDLPNRSVALSDEQQAQVDALLSRLKEQGVRPDTDAAFDGDLLEYLEAQQLIVRLKGGVNLERQTYEGMVSDTRTLLEAQERATLAEVRDQLGTSRKIAQAFLEHLDTNRITRRVGDARVLWHG